MLAYITLCNTSILTRIYGNTLYAVAYVKVSTVLICVGLTSAREAETSAMSDE